MIIVDINVPVVNKNYDFSVNEKVQIVSVIEEVSEIIAQKEGCMAVKSPEKFLLCNKDNGIIFHPDRTLDEYGIGNGACLMLV